MLTEKLRYFLTIAEYRNITKAAESLFIAQPSLSKYLKCLEADLGSLCAHIAFNPHPSRGKILQICTERGA